MAETCKGDTETFHTLSLLILIHRGVSLMRARITFPSFKGSFSTLLLAGSEGEGFGAGSGSAQ